MESLRGEETYQFYRFKLSTATTVGDVDLVRLVPMGERFMQVRMNAFQNRGRRNTHVWAYTPVSEQRVSPLR
jgi:hypothetical protein